jgi:hypothetical protein
MFNEIGRQIINSKEVQYWNIPAFLPFLGSTAQLKPWPPQQNSAEFLGGF